MGFVRYGDVTAIFCVIVPILGWIFSFVYYLHTKRIVIDPKLLENDNDNSHLIINEDFNAKQMARIFEVYQVIFEGAKSFLFAEYIYIGYFMAGFSVLLLLVLGFADTWLNAGFTVIAFLVGCATSVLAGYVGMAIGTFANARTAVRCQQSLADGFITAFKAAVVMGFCLCSFGIFNLYVLIMLFRLMYSNAFTATGEKETEALFEAIAGFGLGGSSIALFGRVGGGIYTKCADVGADLVGKLEAGIPEDDPRNPATIADNVGDNVGDIAGMGADLFGSFAEASCAALVIAAQTGQLLSSGVNSVVWRNWGYVSFPLMVSASGVIACFFTSFFATHFFPPRRVQDIEPTLKRQILISTVLETCFLLILCFTILPSDTYFAGYVVTTVKSDQLDFFENPIAVKNWYLFFCVASGLWAGLGIGYVTEYYTSNQYQPVQELANTCTTGAATNIIIGLALGYKSTIFPACAMALATFIGHSLAGFYGVALCALGILSTLSIGLTIDAFGPICDNAGGIAEMCDMGDETRRRTDALDAAGNTTAAIGKGFAIGSAAFVSLALFSGFMVILQNRDISKFAHVDLLHAFPFAGLLVGAMIPYWFSAMTMAAVGRAAFAMVQEVRQQFLDEPGILTGEVVPNYAQCIAISTDASLKEMFGPGLLVMGTPIFVGYMFGCKALAGVLIGALCSGVQGAISASNSGGAWDNAKKFIEQGKLGDEYGKGSNAHAAAIVGDTVGDPLKDTSGPSLNIVMKLMAVESLVFAKAFYISAPGLLGYIATKV